jgi:uncharacterized Zn finger protein
MILRECDTCERRTVQNRRQRTEGENGQAVIRTEYTCTNCGTVTTKSQQFDGD